MRNKKWPSLRTVEGILKNHATCQCEIDGKWYPARSLGLMSFWSRVRLVWRVFTGECDALKWPGGQ